MQLYKKFLVTRFYVLLIATWIFAVSTIQMCVFAQQTVAPVPSQIALSSLFTQRQELMTADGIASDRFGTAIAINGDLAVIGSPTTKVEDHTITVQVKNTVTGATSCEFMFTRPNP